MKEDISIKEMLTMSRSLWEENKDSWQPMTSDYARDSILYVVEEVGEVISIVKKKGEEKIMNDEDVREHFLEEMCDVLMYYNDVLNRFGVTSEELAKAYHKKFDSNMARDYKKDHAKS